MTTREAQRSGVPLLCASFVGSLDFSAMSITDTEATNQAVSTTRVE